MLLKSIINFLTGRISDEEVAAHEWILCPNCQVNIIKEDLEGNNYTCPSCNTKINIEKNATGN